MQGSRSVFIRIMLFALVCLGSAGSLGLAVAHSDSLVAEAKARLWAADALPTIALATASASQALSDASMRNASSFLPTSYAAGTRLAFQSYRDGNWEIYVTQGDGANPVRLTNEGSPDLRPRFNHDASRIVFASRRSGNYDLYAMNADGSNVNRLTYSPEDESAPSWSPDGRRIAFARVTSTGQDIFAIDAGVGGETRLTFIGVQSTPSWSPDGSQIIWLRRKDATSSYLMVMNADGSEPRTLTEALRYAQNPVWSPLGDRVALDCDIDRDNWNEIVTFDLNTRVLNIAYDLQSNLTDAWMGAWSPTGQHLIFTAAGYTLQDNHLLLSSGRLVLLQPGVGVAYLPGSGIDIAPDWQASDRQAPVSTFEALPPESPAPVRLQWSGVDRGAAGLESFDVQVQAGTGQWSDWLKATTLTSASFPATGGDALAFRVRARDVVGNVEPWPISPDTQTTVESEAPVSQMASLPAWSPQTVLLYWQGSDPGGSGVKNFELHSRDLDGGEWKGEKSGVMTTFGLVGSPGRRYAYRVRGIDWADNVESWPATPDGDTSTQIYAFKVAGRTLNNNGAPLAATAIAASPAASISLSGESQEAFAAYFLTDSPPYSITWSKAGYGVLPAARFAGGGAVDLDVVLPPRDNVVQNGDFEGPTSLEPWLGSGAARPTVTNTLPHTGGQAAAFGAGGIFLPPVNPWNGDAPQIAHSNDGILHMIRSLEWQQPPELFYIQQRPDGTWSDLYNFSNTATSSGAHRMAVSAEGVVHIVWQEGSSSSRIYYARRDPDGVWLPARPIPAPAYENVGEKPQITVDNDGNAHIFWSNTSLTDRVSYIRVDPNGAWTAIETVNEPKPWNRQHTVSSIAADSVGNVHVAWYTSRAGESRMYYRMRHRDGAWSAIQTFGSDLSYAQYAPALAVDSRNRVHLLWQSGDPACLSPCYSSKGPEDVWSEPETLAAGLPSLQQPGIAVDGQHTVHALWALGGRAVQYAYRQEGQTWSQPAVLDAGAPDSKSNLQLAVAVNGIAVATWEESLNHRRILYYTRLWPGGEWERARPVAPWADRSANSDLIIEASGAPHLVWVEQPSASRRIYYAGPALSSQTVTPRLSQVVTLPDLLSDPVLSFFYRFDQTYPGAGSFFDVRLRDAIGVTTLVSTTVPTGDWSHRWVDLSSWAGQTITVSFGLRQPAGGPAVWAYVDDVSLGSSTYPDLYASAPPSQIALPSQPITLTIAYGNQGDGLAREASVSVSLPVSLSYTSASPPPTQTTDTLLIWRMDALSPQAGPELINLSLLPADDALPGTVARPTLAITSTTMELNTTNNQSVAWIFVGGEQWYLPLILHGAPRTAASPSRLLR